MKITVNNKGMSGLEQGYVASIKLAYRQTKSDLKYVKYKSNFWKGKTYIWGRTHLSIAWHNIYWHIIKHI